MALNATNVVFHFYNLTGHAVTLSMHLFRQPVHSHVVVWQGTDGDMLGEAPQAHGLCSNRCNPGRFLAVRQHHDMQTTHCITVHVTMVAGWGIRCHPPLPPLPHTTPLPSWCSVTGMMSLTISYQQSNWILM